MPSEEAEMRLSLSQSLRSLVSNKFSHARSTQSLVFSDTHLATLSSEAGISFQLRYCPALSKKPTENKRAPPPPQTSNQDSSSTGSKKKFDPFENPSPELLIVRVPDRTKHTHNLVLNKFPVIPNHFILATRDNRPQTNILEESDLSLTYACLQAWHDHEQHNLYAFFNSGEHSGASQPHRHLQFISVEDMKGSASSSTWDLLCDRMTTPIHPTLPLLHDPRLPILHLATPLSASTSSSELYDKYLLLMRATAVLMTTSDRHSLKIADLLTSANLDAVRIATETGRTVFSYNLALTTRTMAILPRRAEDAILPELNSISDDCGRVSVNGTILAGTLMVKNEDEWDLIKARPELLDNMLKQVAFARTEAAKI